MLFWTQKKFFEAAATGDEKTVAAYLAKNKSFVHVQDKKTKESAIHLAAKNGHAGIVRELLKAGASVWSIGANSLTPLHNAAANGHAEVVKVLLEAGGDAYINTTDGSGMSPLQYAILANRTEVLKIFLDTKKADMNAGDKPALYFAVESKRQDCVEILLAAGADPNVPRTVTRYEYDDDYDDYYHPRSSPGKSTVLKYSPLNCACSANEAVTAVMLLKAGAKALPGEYPLHAAAAWGNIPLVKTLIQYGTDPRAINDERKTALHSVLQTKPSMAQTDMVEFLLAQGLEKNALDRANRTPLSYAQQYALTDIIRILRDPRPPQALQPVRPVMPPPVMAVAPTLPAPVPVAMTMDDETWQLSGKNRVVHVTVYPGLNRRLTEIFNFEARERVAITENLALKTETMGPHENFETIGDEALKKALDEFRRLGGAADDACVFGNRLMKMKIKPL